MRPRRATRLAAALAALLAAGCAYEPKPVAPPADIVPPRWVVDGGSAAVERDWWQGFGDPVLTRLVEEALARNDDLRLAVARLAEARALAAVQRADEYPQLGVGAGAQRSRAISPLTGRPYLWHGQQAEFQASYEIDLWGRIAAGSAAADANTESVRVQRDAVALGVAAGTAGGYITLRSLDAQLEVAQRTLASRERTVALMRNRTAAGYSSTLDLAQAEADLHATAQAIPQIGLAIERQERALNLLLARPPGPVERGAALQGLQLRGPPAAGLPSELLRRRPDIVAAELQVVAADARLAAARAQMLPSVALQASFGGVASSVLREGPFSLWSLGGSILAPLFEGGRLRGLADAAASRRDQALIGYERTVLASFAEVETQLGAFAHQQAQLVEADAQREALERALRIASRRYREGYSSFLDELLAQRSLFNVEQGVLQLRAELLITEVNVYRALGGAWSADMPPLASAAGAAR